MSDGTHIEWTDASWTPFRAWGNEREALGWGCEKVSEGCQHCYAETINRRLGTGLPYSVKAVERSGGQHYLDENALLKPLSWKKPRRIFVSSMTDIFGEWVPFEWLDRVFAVMALTPQHTYQVLTKRPERMREWFTIGAQHIEDQRDYTRTRVSDECIRLQPEIIEAEPEHRRVPWPLPNVWLGVSVENQRWADVRVPELLATPAAVRFISAEPLLGPLQLEEYLHDSDCWARFRDPPAGLCICNEPREEHISWVIVGGESGPGARPCDLDWIRDIVRQCQAACVAVFVKQLGARPCVGSVETAAGSNVFVPDLVRLRDRKGGDMSEWPEDLRVREMPV